MDFQSNTIDFLSLFPNSNNPPTFVFQSKDDGRGSKDKAITSKYGKVWHKASAYNSKLIQWLKNNNNDGWGCFFTVNEIDQTLDPSHKRTEEMLTRIRAVWVEDDNKRDEPRTDWKLEPSVIVNSSPGKFHYYWLTNIEPDEANKEEWHGVMATLVNEYQCDNNAKDLVRVLRLPGFYHMKNPDEPHLVTFSVVSGAVYMWSDITLAFPPSEFKDQSPSKSSDAPSDSRTISDLLRDYRDGHRHGPSHKAAMKLANHNVPKDDIIEILCALFPENSLDHHTQSVTSAIDKIQAEKKYLFHEVDSNIDEARILPHFDTSFKDTWPDPWPMIFKTFESAIYQVIEEIYVPSCFAYHSVMLGSVFRTVRGRGPNLNMQIISASGVGKDSNTSEPIERIASVIRSEFAKKEGDSNQLGKMLLSPIYESITADTTYLKTLNFDENKAGGLILNTEASGHWDMVASADNPHTEGVMRIEINAWDGHNISGKVVGKSRYEDIQNPNYTMLRLQQTEAIERNLTQRMIDIGLGNRIDYYADNIERPEVASTELSDKDISISREYIEFLEFLFKFIHTHQNSQIKVVTSQRGGVIHQFETEFMLPMVNGGGVSKDEYKFLKRIIGSAEKQVTEIVAFVYVWRLFNGIDTKSMVRKSINGILIELDGSEFEKYVVPLMEYQLKIRRFLFNNILNTSQATAETEAINEVWTRCSAKVGAPYRPWHEKGGIVAAHFHDRVKVHKFFSKNKKYANPEIITRAINSWAIINGLELKKLSANGKNRTCYVMTN